MEEGSTGEKIKPRLAPSPLCFCELQKSRLTDFIERSLHCSHFQVGCERLASFSSSSKRPAASPFCPVRNVPGFRKTPIAFPFRGEDLL